MLLSQMGVEECFWGITRKGGMDFQVWVGKKGEGPPVGYVDVSAFKGWILAKHGPKAREHIASGPKCR